MATPTKEEMKIYGELMTEIKDIKAEMSLGHAGEQRERELAYELQRAYEQRRKLIGQRESAFYRS